MVGSTIHRKKRIGCLRYDFVVFGPFGCILTTLTEFSHILSYTSRTVDCARGSDFPSLDTGGLTGTGTGRGCRIERSVRIATSYQICRVVSPSMVPQLQQQSPKPRLVVFQAKLGSRVGYQRV